MSGWLPIVSRELCAERLELIFPRMAFDTSLSNPLAATAIAAMIYVGAVQNPELTAEDQRYIRPSTVLWLRDVVLTGRTAEAERHEYLRAALGPKANASVTELMARWNIQASAWYRENTRETLRDETLPGWRALGAVADRPGVKTSSPHPRWILTRPFATLFNPTLEGDALYAAIADWIAQYTSASGRLKSAGVRRMAQAEHAIDVRLPTGESRRLEPGTASLILKGVVEQWAPQRLRSPIVISISEPGTKMAMLDREGMAAAGIHLDVAKLLPDALLADSGTEPLQFWIVEAVATDGPIDEPRKAALLEWALSQGIPANHCRFLTAFVSRNSGPAKRRLKDLASGTHAWFLDEPGCELAWGVI
ncbi:BsuBI/PstI family type II restriction endonuclease [Cryobacterium sp. Y11]|uniref:BsuBI/PstI family type II restriction endonuclease n=1 Tax=Cryobacterium sp. Y11 TaxID=2045016 RepID=UPI000CE4AE35|nr:BsuBI/PstI family type II restriction endonuclease [Cryobacterium sp. Y11]